MDEIALSKDEFQREQRLIDNTDTYSKEIYKYDTTVYKDDYDCVYDVDNFDVKAYLKRIFKDPKNVREEDWFPVNIIWAYGCFLLSLVAIEGIWFGLIIDWEEIKNPSFDRAKTDEQKPAKFKEKLQGEDWDVPDSTSTFSIDRFALEMDKKNQYFQMAVKDLQENKV